MKLDAFDYELPPERIAQVPSERRDEARLLVHDIARDASEHARVRELPRLLRAGDLLVLNESRVRRARVFGRRASGGRTFAVCISLRTRSSREPFEATSISAIVRSGIIPCRPSEQRR